MMEEEELISKIAKNLIEKFYDEDFSKENEGKWVVFLKDNRIIADKSLKVLVKKYKDNIVGSFQVPSRDSVMLL